MKHKASWILAIVLVIAGCVLRFAMPVSYTHLRAHET